MVSSAIATTSEDSLSRYFRQMRKYPVLTQEEELTLSRLWRDTGNIEAAHKLVTSHLRLVVKIAMGYRGYGLPMNELVSEGTVGMMQAVRRFDPDKGFRLATYAMWWIRAAIQEYILHNWSLVKMGTTVAQKKLFFNLRQLKGEMQAIDEGDLSPEQINKIATRLSVPEQDVIDMNRRLAAPDHSLNTPVYTEHDHEWQDRLVDEQRNQEEHLAENEEISDRKAMLKTALAQLTPREHDIFIQRRLKEEPVTLEDLAHKYGISRERVRQIEARAFEKVQETIAQETKESL
ncbi:MAG: RNA polymerase sigma factor RpoH [Acetobacter sp.]|nr:RNA polymerase sigma factor RpoH [Acetobacter sp.]